MVDYGFSSVGVKVETRNLINEIASFHGLKVSDFMMLLMNGYAFSSPEGREIVLDIGATIQKHINKGMQPEFEDSLNVSEACIDEIANANNKISTDQD